jgi:ABC-type nitrate/sulfonate/bicarbonate transport system permease component
MNSFQIKKNFIRIILSFAFFALLVPLSYYDPVAKLCRSVGENCNNLLFANIYFTLFRAIIVFLFASFLGTLCGVAIWKYKILSPLIRLMDFLRSIPALVFYTLLVVIFFKQSDINNLWILSFNFAFYPVVFAVYGTLINLKAETLYSIEQLNLSKKYKNYYIWFPIIWQRTKESGYRLSISNSILAVVTMEFILSGGACNLCAGRSEFLCAPGVGGIFAAIENNATSLKDNLWTFVMLFIFIGVTGIIVNIVFVDLLDAIYRKVLRQ